MAAETGSVSERVARLEGAYDHLATKADVERLRSTLLMTVGGAAGTILMAIAIATTVIIWALG